MLRSSSEARPTCFTNILMGHLQYVIIPEIVTMEVDAPTFHANGKLPILDLEVWVESGSKLMHSFYKKSVSSKKVVMARSALSNQSKRSIMVSEAFRRLANCHPDLPLEQMATFLTEFNVAMCESGHEEGFRRMVTERAISKYVSACQRRQETGVEMYRSKEERKEAIRKTGGKPGKAEWFQRLGYQNTLQVPATLGSKLVTIVKNVLDKSDPPAGFKTLVLEDGGRSVKSDIAL